MDPFPVPSNYHNVSSIPCPSSSSSLSNVVPFPAASSSSSTATPVHGILLSSIAKPISRPFKPTTVPLQTEETNMFIEALIVTSLVAYNDHMFNFPYLCRDLFFDTTFNDTLCNHSHPTTKRTRLHYACKMDNVERVRWLLKRNPHCLNMDNKGNSCLHHALENWISFRNNNDNTTTTTSSTSSYTNYPLQPHKTLYYPLVKSITPDTISIVNMLLTKQTKLASTRLYKDPQFVGSKTTPYSLYVALRNPEMPEEIIMSILNAYPNAAQYIDPENKSTCLSYAVLHHPWPIIQAVFLANPVHIFQGSLIHGTHTLRCIDLLEAKGLMDSDYTDIIEFIKQYILEHNVQPDDD